MFKVIINPSVAKKLLTMGNPIVDIKPNKDVINATVFIFEETDKFIKDLSTIVNK